MQMELHGFKHPRSWVRIPPAPLAECRGAVAQPGRARKRFIDTCRHAFYKCRMYRLRITFGTRDKCLWNYMDLRVQTPSAPLEPKHGAAFSQTERISFHST